MLHKALLYVAGGYPVLADIHYYRVGRHLGTSVRMSIPKVLNRHDRRWIFGSKIVARDVENR
jgi:hypothetical protein